MCSAIWLKDKNIKIIYKPNNIEYGVVYCGYRHCDCIELMSLQYNRNEVIKIGLEQGFLTAKKRFINRGKAMSIVIEQNQLLDRNIYHNELYSEDVWL